MSTTSKRTRAVRRRLALGPVGALKRRILPTPWPPTLDPPTTAPPPPPGQVTGPPDYVGIGAARAGSSWLETLVRSHPLVQRQPWGKELHYFDRYYDRPFGPAEAAGYHEWFPRREAMTTGEWTPGYLYQPWTRELLDRSAPGARLLVILRDPLEQFASSVNWSVQSGAPANGLLVTRHLAEAAYAGHLRSWFDHHGDRMLVLQSEVCFADPAAARRRAWDHIGLEDDPVALPARGRNEGRVSAITLTDEVRRSVVEHLEPDVLALARAWPELDLARWPNFAHLA